MRRNGVGRCEPEEIDAVSVRLQSAANEQWQSKDCVSNTDALVRRAGAAHRLQQAAGVQDSLPSSPCGETVSLCWLIGYDGEISASLHYRRHRWKTPNIARHKMKYNLRPSIKPAPTTRVRVNPTQGGEKSPVSKWVSDWATEWLSDWVTEWVSDWVSEWVSEWLSDWISDWVTEWLSE